MFKLTFTFFSVFLFNGIHSDLHFLEQFSAVVGFQWHFRGSGRAPCPLGRVSLRKLAVLTQLPAKHLCPLLRTTTEQECVGAPGSDAGQRAPSLQAGRKRRHHSGATVVRKESKDKQRDRSVRKKTRIAVRCCARGLGKHSGCAPLVSAEV